MYEPARLRVNPNRKAGELFPLMTREQLRATAPEGGHLAGVEVIREAATLLMLSGVALVAVGNRNLWLPAFAVAFGTWDLFYYVFLKLLVDWPASLLTWDVLFLIPAPWAAPVLAPAIVSVSIIVTGLVALRRPVQMRLVHWIAIGLSVCLILLSFVWDSPNLMRGGLPSNFSWTVFGLGELLGVSAFIHAARASLRRAAHVTP
jgi:hypothetical protein